MFFKDIDDCEYFNKIPYRSYEANDYVMYVPKERVCIPSEKEGLEVRYGKDDKKISSITHWVDASTIVINFDDDIRSDVDLPIDEPFHVKVIKVIEEEIASL